MVCSWFVLKLQAIKKELDLSNSLIILQNTWWLCGDRTHDKRIKRAWLQENMFIINSLESNFKSVLNKAYQNIHVFQSVTNLRSTLFHENIKKTILAIFLKN
jgi:hypothetical protein